MENKANFLEQHEWNNETVSILEKVRKNSVMLSEYHRKRYYHFKSFSKYFDLPILVMSICGSSFAVGTQGYLSQNTISGVSCIIGVFVSIITSIKLYLNIEVSMQSEFKMSKDFYTLSIDIYKTLSLDEQNRGENGLQYLQKCFSVYCKLMESSHLLSKRFKHDHLTPLDYYDNIELNSIETKISKKMNANLLCCKSENFTDTVNESENEKDIELPLHMFQEIKKTEQK